MWFRAFFATTILCVVANGEDKEVKTDAESGLTIDAQGSWQLVQTHCAACHSLKTVRQHSLDKDGWRKSIERMQKEEGLWDLEDSESLIIDYLSEYYGVNSEREGALRRAPLNQPPITVQSGPDPAKKSKLKKKQQAK